MKTKAATKDTMNTRTTINTDTKTETKGTAKANTKMTTSVNVYFISTYLFILSADGYFVSTYSFALVCCKLFEEKLVNRLK